MVASPRAALREKLLKIIGSLPAPAMEAAGGAEALLKLKQGRYSTLLLDQRIEDLDVHELVATIRRRYPKLNVVVLNREDEVQEIPCRLGAGTLDESSARTSPVARAAAQWSGSFELCGDVVEDTSPRVDPLPGMVGESAQIQRVYRLARLVAARDTAVLIMGATGTGKELVARGIHALSSRSRGPFVVVNCAATPETLLETELFGFARGPFTGASQSQLGRIHVAHNGTVLLDEVGDLPLGMQAKLLRFVQEGEVQRLGSSDVFRVNVRVIASTSADLFARIREKQFREDLYYRLAVYPLELPPLRDRAQDILPLAGHFLDSFCRQSRCPQKLLGSDAAQSLLQYPWPGNVRELRHRIERAFVLAETREQIRARDLAMPSEQPD
jgi:DNA-binding NtrC family response regulator